MKASLDKFKDFLQTTRTIEHYEGYCCKGICHVDMRCIDLPDSHKVCKSGTNIELPQTTIDFLRQETASQLVANPEWVEQVTAIIEKAVVSDSRDTTLCKSSAPPPEIRTKTRYCA